jgi:RHS repeat-associated protein
MRLYALGPALRTAGLLAVLSLPAAHAQEHPNVARGFNPSATFAAGDVDNINLFNGNLVLTLPLGQRYPVNGGLSYGLTLVYNSQVWEQQDYNGLVQSIPNRTSNAGLGWTVSLGRIDPPEFLGDFDTFRHTYMSPDGSRHTFYSTLHEGETATPGIEYSRDGSYLRYNTATRTIEFPDGTRHSFDSSGFPVQIRDRFGNHADICYNPSCGAPANAWQITDSQGRFHRIFFKTLTGASYQSQVVDRVSVAAFGGTAAEYTFHYNLDAGQPVILTGCKNSDPQTANLAVALLTGLTLPDGTSYSMPVTSYFGNTGGSPCKNGMINGLTLPTLGRIEWDYIRYQFPTESTRRTAWQNTAGVGTRTLRDAAGTALGTWIYSTALTPTGSPAQPSRELVNTVVDPLGNRVVHYFSVAATFFDTVERFYEYGLPLSRDQPGDGTGRFLSNQAFGTGTVPLRSSYVRYEHDQPYSVGVTLQDQSRLNQRAAAQRTVFHDDGGTFADELFADFDGLGHYRTRQTNGNFPGSNVRTSFTFYNAAQGTYGQSNFVMWPAGSPWILGTYAFDWNAEGSNIAFRSYCWDANGLLLRQRVHQANSSAQGNADLVQTYSYTSGNLTNEAWYGGDTQTVGITPPGGDFCALALPAPVYQMNHTYAAGVRASSAYAGTTFKTLDLTVDANTGLPSQSRDTARIATSYTYDSMGRPLTVVPAGEAMTTYTYRLAGGASSLARVTVARVTSPGAPALAERRIDFDAFGRPVKEEQRMPDDSWSARQTAYNALGWKTFVSEQGSPFGTTFLNFDPFGRPRTLRPADGAAHDVTLAYSGARQISRTAKVATGPTAETAATTTEVYDRHGRLYEVTEPNGTKTRYEYDVGNRLAKVCQGATAVSCGQTRLLTYDNRGFLISEQHPEKTAGNLYSYDARGHAARTIDGANDLTFVFDKAERLVLARESGAGFVDCANNGGHRCLKTFTYAGANGTTTQGATDFKQGKLTAASRTNYVGAPFNATVEVKETYEYGGPGGRTSQRDTSETFNGTALEAFRQSFSWDNLGNLAGQAYPDCIAPSVCGASSPRTVGNGYTKGFLTSVPGFASSLTYAANGMVTQVTHTNAVVDVQDLDPTGLPRPAGLRSTRNGVDVWNAGGAFQYDGSGNLWKQGANAYTYDPLSRLANATLYDAPAGGGVAHQQSFSYDAYGNLQSLTTDGSLLSTPTSGATNRLTSGTYDAWGNLTAWNGNTYEYDAFHQMKRMVSGGEDWRYIYTAGDERFWMYRVGGGGSIWTLRGLDDKVLREYQAHAGWGTFKDYIYRGSILLAEADSAALGGTVRHLHTDHLGTVRALTGPAGQRLAYHLYWPYGQELTAFNQDTERLKFTGHERDLASLAGAGDDLDYMHARHFSLITGRFLSVDPLGGDARAPQSWNGYAYVRGNPLKYIDPTGMAEIDACSGNSCSGSVDAVLPNDSTDLSGFESFLLTSYNFAGGASNALASNFLFGAGRYDSTNSAYQWGQSVGDGASILIGLQEALAGGGGEVLGLGLDLTGVGVAIGVPVNVVSGAAIAHGSTASGLGFVHLMEGRKGGGRTGRKINQDRADVARGKIERLKAEKAQAKTNSEKEAIQKQIDHWRRKLKQSEEHARVGQGN